MFAPSANADAKGVREMPMEGPLEAIELRVLINRFSSFDWFISVFWLKPGILHRKLVFRP